MINNFPACCDFTFSQEGGYVDNPDDHGLATNMGITEGALSTWRSHPVTAEDVQNLTRAEAYLIYDKNYWCPINGDNLPPGVDLMVFDFGVNAGPGTSAKRLQGLLKLPQDGSIGPQTLGSVRAHDAKWLITMLGYSQAEYYRSLGQPEFTAGWLARVTRRQAAAEAMRVRAIMPAVAIS